MTKKYYLVIIAILVLLNVFSWRIWWVYPPAKQPFLNEIMEKGKGRRDAGGMRLLVGKLQLDEHQKQRFEELRIEYFTEIRVVDEKIKALRKELLEHLMQEEVSMNKDSIFETMARCKMEYEAVTFRHFSEMRNLCNKDQKEVFDTLFTQMTKRSNKFHNHSHMEIKRMNKSNIKK